jgi:hypothetical protein
MAGAPNSAANPLPIAVFGPQIRLPATWLNQSHVTEKQQIFGAQSEIFGG